MVAGRHAGRLVHQSTESGHWSARRAHVSIVHAGVWPAGQTGDAPLRASPKRVFRACQHGRSILPQSLQHRKIIALFAYATTRMRWQRQLTCPRLPVTSADAGA